jgi:hypothetical protein
MCRRQLDLTATTSSGDIEEAERFMRNNVYNDRNKEILLQKFDLTRKSRRAFVTSKEKGHCATTILQKYPLLAEIDAV